MLSDYEVRARSNRDKNGSGLLTYRVSESIFSELTIAKKKWFCMSFYRLPDYSNLDAFFNEVTISL